jgi:hypothetical protein
MPSGRPWSSGLRSASTAGWVLGWNFSGDRKDLRDAVNGSLSSILQRERERKLGRFASGPVWMKLYTQKDMPTLAHSLDDPLYPNESRLEPGDLRPGNLPETPRSFITGAFACRQPAPGFNQVLLRAFYGNGFVSDAPFSLAVK